MPDRVRADEDGMDHEARQATRDQTWTFLTNHAAVLVLIADNPGISIAALSNAAGISTRAAQMIVADLCRAGYIARERVGRSNRYTVDLARPLRRTGFRERANVTALPGMTAPTAAP
ncbi:MAG TPA: helix-turn-helix domain-containing protein, partial [Gaiellales bacterium]|jgi:predicted transcriptional regulator